MPPDKWASTLTLQSVYSKQEQEVEEKNVQKYGPPFRRYVPHLLFRWLSPTPLGLCFLYGFGQALINTLTQLVLLYCLTHPQFPYFVVNIVGDERNFYTETPC